MCVGSQRTVKIIMRIPAEFASVVIQDISLVQRSSGEMLFVHWTHVPTKSGRIIRLDAATSASKTPVGARGKVQQFDDCAVVISRTGGVHKQGRYKHRRQRCQLGLCDSNPCAP